MLRSILLNHVFKNVENNLHMINDHSAVVINVVLLVHHTFYMNATLYMNTSVSIKKNSFEYHIQ